MKSKHKTLIAALILVSCAAGAFALTHWRSEFAYWRVDRSWTLTRKPLAPTSTTLDGTYLPAYPASDFGGPIGIAIRGNEVIFEQASDVIEPHRMPGEYTAEVLSNTDQRNGNAFDRATTLLLRDRRNPYTLLIHPRSTRRYLFLVMDSHIVPYTLGSILDGEDGTKGCLGAGDFIKVSDTPSNEFSRFSVPTGFRCAEGPRLRETTTSPTKKLVLDMLMELYSTRQQP